MTEDLIYRKGTVSDIDRLKQLTLVSYGQFKDVITRENWESWKNNFSDEKTYRQLLAAGTCFVCEHRKVIAGMAFFIPSGTATQFFQADWSYIRLVGVDPGYNGRGIGKKLTILCIEAAKQTGEKTLALHTSEFQNAAVHIYEKLGFQKQREFLLWGKKYWIFTLPVMTKKNSEPITYHRAGMDDIRALVDLRIEFMLGLDGNQSAEKIVFLKKELSTYYESAIQSKSCFAYFAKSGNEIVGTGLMAIRKQPGNFKNPSGISGYLMNMYTLPAYRRKGICTGILKMIFEDAEEAGITLLELTATKEGEAVYVQNGFQRHPEPVYRKYTNC